jgi:hypothetical protein
MTYLLRLSVWGAALHGGPPAEIIFWPASKRLPKVLMDRVNLETSSDMARRENRAAIRQR